jgi:hypothetical protein
MKPTKKYQNLNPEFWANIKLLNQRLGYTVRKTKSNPQGGFKIPTVGEVEAVFNKEGLNDTKLIQNGSFTKFGNLIVDYMKYRGDILTNSVEPNLMDKDQAEKLFTKIFKSYTPTCPLPTNKQKGDKKGYAYLTCLVNMLIEKEIGNRDCNYDPKELTALTENNFPIRTLSRRVDGAYPAVIDPIAIWEIKEYYYTTTFGSRVADGVYETQLDGWELWEAELNANRKVYHYLIADAHYTWWTMGRSYLCRIIDSLHMGLIDEVLFGKEVVDRIPVLARSWIKKKEESETQNNIGIAAEPKTKYKRGTEDNNI